MVVQDQVEGQWNSTNTKQDLLLVFSQVEGIDSEETFSVVKVSIIKVVLSIDVSSKWESGSWMSKMHSYMVSCKKKYT